MCAAEDSRIVFWFGAKDACETDVKCSHGVSEGDQELEL